MLIEKLHKQSGVSLTKLRWIAHTASKRYKVYQIPKRSGGLRTIEHPSRELKAIQRWVNHFLLRKLPVHSSATAYYKGASIKANALRHVHTKFTTRIDFSNFFPSFQYRHVALFLERVNSHQNLGLTPDDIAFICAIVIRYNHLTIGAPSSPILTNAMMFNFDHQLNEYTTNRGLIYTRYADDIFISSVAPNKLDGIVETVSGFCTDYDFSNLVINTDKTAHLSRRYKRSITGLILTPDHKISVGRAKKKEIKSLIHRHTQGTIEQDRLTYLAGTLAFIADAEPTFLASLITKYGEAVVQKIMHKAE